MAEFARSERCDALNGGVSQNVSPESQPDFLAESTNLWQVHGVAIECQRLNLLIVNNAAKLTVHVNLKVTAFRLVVVSITVVAPGDNVGVISHGFYQVDVSRWFELNHYCSAIILMVVAVAILMDREFDRQREEARLKAEQEKREHEERLKREAEEKARAEAEAKAKAEIEAAARREAEAKAAAERAERERIEAEQRAQREAKEAAERAEREKQAAIEAERRKAQEEAERIRRDAEAKEQARIAEEKRIKDEEERRAKDKAHRKEVNNKILADLIKVGASEDVAKNIITAIVKGEVFATKIIY